jgi:hypothetical protein
MHVMTRCASGILRNNRCHPRCSLIKQQLHFTADNDILMIIFTAQHTAYPSGQFRQVLVGRKKLLTSKRRKNLLWNCRTQQQWPSRMYMSHLTFSIMSWSRLGRGVTAPRFMPRQLYHRRQDPVRMRYRRRCPASTGTRRRTFQTQPIIILPYFK